MSHRLFCAYSLPVYLLVTLGAFQPLHATVVAVRGEMRSEVVTVDRRVVHVPEGVHRFRMLIPGYPSFSGSSNSQSVVSFKTTFNVPPTTSHPAVDSYGNHYTEAIWLSPSPGDIVQSTQAQLNLEMQATPTATVAYPLVKKAIPKDVLPYLQPTALVQSGDSEIHDTAAAILKTCDIRDEDSVVDATVIWVVDHLHYSEGGAEDALSALRQRSGECTAYSHLCIALLRNLGIPARFAAGLKFQSSYSIQGRERTYVVAGDRLSGFLYHAWIQVYFPGRGWVEYDPQGDFGFVDTRCILFAVAPDKDSLPEGRFISTFAALDNPTDFSEDSTAFVTVLTDHVQLTQGTSAHPGPMRDGIYMARASE